MRPLGPSLAILPATVLGLAVSLPGPAHAAQPDSPVPSDPVFTALLTDATTVSGQIRQLGPGGQVTLVVAEKDEQSLPLSRVVKLTRRGGEPPPIPPEGPMVLFPEGDRLRASIGQANEAALEVQCPALGDLQVPLESLFGVIFAPPSDRRNLEPLLRRIREEPRDAEVLWLSNGDRLEGGYLGLSADKVTFQPPTGKVEIPRPGLVALGFDPDLVEYPRPAGPFLELTFTDGSRLGVSDVRVERGQVVGTSRFGRPIRLALADLARVLVLDGSVAYLSEREETAAQYVGYLGEPLKTYGRNRTISQRTLRLGSQPYDRGLGTRPRTLLAYRLGPTDRRFQALVGLDDEAGAYGNVVFRVLVDGQQRFVSPPRSARDEPIPIDVDVSGARVLILVTEFGERGDVQDEADWVEARLVRDPAPPEPKAR